MSGKTKRVEGVDAVRGLAIILMVFSHGLNWFHVKGSHDVFSIGRLSLGDAATPLFFVIAGTALSLSLGARRRSEDTPREKLAAAYRRRFRQLFLLGVPISFAWGVLQAQAVVLGVLVFLALHVFERETDRSGIRRWPLVLGGAAWALHVAAVFADVTWPVLSPLLRGQFPLLAIVALVSFGFALGGLLHQSAWPRQFAVLGGGMLLLAWAASGMTTNGYAGPGAAPLVRSDMPVPFVLAGLGATWLLLATSAAPVVARSRCVGWLARLGRYGLFIYLFHYVPILLFSWLLGWWHALDTPAALAASSALVVVTVFVGLHWRMDARAIYGWLDGLARRWGDTSVHPSGGHASASRLPATSPSTASPAPSVERSRALTALHGHGSGFPRVW